jgi:predicted nucleic acid-binding protein
MVDIVTTEGGKNALVNLERKAQQADKMFDRLILHMRDAVHIERTNKRTVEMGVPAWL